ncbi:trypsin 3A1-like [Belonocnema kinseyi]|uniref:trypsin 3A1-like n=1 Tax=Belonocnema kinseyi TaxID=2817044 RepID=UPI00143DD18C|nr:trypsin 3A1-like [Belonocnema kinseyi]
MLIKLISSAEIRTQVYRLPAWSSTELDQESADLEESWDLHIRRKRVIDRTLHGNRPVAIHEVPYIVNVKANKATICGGSILAPKIILTAAHCFLWHQHPLLCKKCSEPIIYTILSGSEERNGGILHTIKKRITHPDFQPPLYSSDLALLVIFPPIDLVHSPNRGIRLYNGFVSPKDFGIFSGWGCTKMIPIVFPNELRSVKVPVISRAECNSYYQTKIKNFTLPEEVFCTHDKNYEKASCGGDSGNPIVFHNQLAGVLAGNHGPVPGYFPDVPLQDHVQVPSPNSCIGTVKITYAGSFLGKCPGFSEEPVQKFPTRQMFRLD